MTNYIATEQIHRWKKEYPNWRMSPLIMEKKENKGKNMPDFCGPNENYQIWLKSQERLESAMLNWPTNQNDVRNKIPKYMEDYRTSDKNEKTFNL